MSASFSFRRWDRRASVVIVSLLLLTGLASYFARASVELYESTRFNALVEMVRDDIEFQMQTYINALIQTKGMLEVKRDITREEFAQYVHSVGLIHQYPGIQGIGYTARISGSALAQHEQRIRRQGFADYRVWPETPRNEYFSIVYLEPFNWRNRRAFGYDMFTDPTRRAAMEVARDSGEPAATERVRLVQEVNAAPQPGFLIYVPLYRAGANPQTAAERRVALEGFIYSPFRARDLFLGIFEPRGEDLPIDFEVFDGPIPNRDNLIFDYDEQFHFGDSNFSAKYQAQLLLPIAGRPWTVLIYSLPQLHSFWGRYVPPIVLVSGLLLTLLVSITMRAHRKQLETSERTTLLLESMSEGVSVSDENGVIVYTNPAEDKMFGYAPGELIGQHVSVQNTYPPEENQRIVNEVIRDLRQHGEWFGEFQNKRKDGASFITFARITTIEISGKKHFVCVQEDISQRKKAEQTLREAIRARDEFLSIASHELRTPLTTLKLQAQLRKKALLANNLAAFSVDKLEKMIDSDNRQLDRLARLVDDMLDISRITTGKLTMEIETLDLALLMREVIERLRPQFEEAGCEVHLQAATILGSWDRFRLEQVLVNLFTNAMKYGAGKPIDVNVSSVNERAIIQVCDRGIGIAAEHQQRIFERFERAVSGSEISGLGLGLYISKTIVEAHGGVIRVDSQVGAGATFIVELPLLGPRNNARGDTNP